MTEKPADLTEFPAAAHPMLLKNYLAGKDEIRDTDFYVVMEFSGNGFTFETRQADQYNVKSDDINRMKIQMSNSEDIRKRPDKDISPKSIEDLKKSLHYLKGLINNLHHWNNKIYIKAIGTAALRDASNAQDIKDMISGEIGDQIDFEIVEGDVEAALTAHGLTLFYPKAHGVVVDMGGGSTEFALLKKGATKDTVSLNMGTGSIGAEEDPKGFVKETFQDLPKAYRKIDTLFLSGGTFRNINKAICQAKGWNIKEDSPPEISLTKYKEFVKGLTKLDDVGWKLMPEALQKRRDFVTQAHEILKRLEKKFPKGTTVALTKTKTRDGLFRLMHDMHHAHEAHPQASVNAAFSRTETALA